VRGSQLCIYETPAECRVEELALATVEGGLRLGHDVRRTRHRLDAAGNQDIAVSVGDRLGGGVDRLETGSA
jgi:hypothetical protein